MLYNLLIKGMAYNIQEIPVEDLSVYVNNSRTHSTEQVKQISNSIKEFGFTNPLLIDKNKEIIAGHGRLMAAKQLGLDKVPCIELSDLSEKQKKAYVIADNQLALNAGWNESILSMEIGDLSDNNFDISLLGFNNNELNKLLEGDPYEDGKKGEMAKNFGFPPFTVFNAREGKWQDRKKYWFNLGINSGSGRGEHLISYSNVSVNDEKDTSIFDPVLCEIMYNWFSSQDGLVLDPFAGGSVRGIVASKCKRNYVGIDLLEQQVEANKKQAKEICKEYMPKWTIGDSVNIKKLFGNKKADMMLSCPPYVNLEVYSNLENDLSNMEYKKFLNTYKKIIKDCYDCLKENTFAVWVVGEVRDKNGNYYNLLGDTISTFIESGFNYYNEAVLITAVGSLPLRSGKIMKKSRKLGKTHQNILIFVKGDGVKATEKCGDVEINFEDDYYGDIL